MKKGSLTYKDAGVDISAADRVKKKFSRAVRTTFDRRVLTDIGLFGGLYDLGRMGYKHPVLVSSIDGVGTKLKVAEMMGRHDSVGEDLVAHCVNDVVVQGARPLIFMDYIGCSKLRPKVYEEIMRGLTRGCRKAGCALIGGETAEMPGLYPGGEYDLVGAIVGIVEKSGIIDGSKIKAGDLIIGLGSSGLHTNGYSLARKIFFEKCRYSPRKKIGELRTTIGAALLKPHINYGPVVRALIDRYPIKGLAHITGGGLVDNIPRILPKGVGAAIERGSWRVPAIFDLIEETGGVPDNDMWRTFNMGIGMAAVVSRRVAPDVMETLRKMRTKAWIIGRIEKGKKEVRII